MCGLLQDLFASGSWSLSVQTEDLFQISFFMKRTTFFLLALVVFRARLALH